MEGLRAKLFLWIFLLTLKVTFQEKNCLEGLKISPKK